MELILHDIPIPIEHDGMEAYLKAASMQLHLDPTTISITKILSKSLDIRTKEQFYYTLSLVVSVSDDFKNRQKVPVYQEQKTAPRRTRNRKERPLIVGFGPAGMFAALSLVEYGYKPIIFERGQRIEERTVAVQRFIKEKELNPESNIQFGEGGAGSYSDGKLFSRRNSNTSTINRVLQTFIQFGAPEEIGYISKPHLGTDVLRKIVGNIRNYILERGGEIHFGAKMTDILRAGDTASGILINNDREYLSSRIYMALGHSARETVAMMHARGVAMEQRPIAVGVRIEHPVATINAMRYGDKYHNCPALGAATYSLNYTNRATRRGVYTFCMCPGGEVVNASSARGLLVVNGMSYSRRSSPYSNAALVVSCHPSDYPSASPLAGLEFQKDIEHRAFLAGGGRWAVPAQNLMHFLGESRSISLHENSYKMGAVPAELKEVLPPFAVAQLLAAFQQWRKEVPLFVSHQAILLGAETRTSSPVRITRNEDFESVTLKNLYPVGEGSGYTGGITSSAADALKAVDRHERHESL